MIALYLLKRLRTPERSGGFTLIELLVVVLIIGVLAAIALPSFLNQVAKAKSAEAKAYIGSINRGQQAYRLEHDTFARTLPELAIGLKAETNNFKYRLDASDDHAAVVVEPRDKSVLGYSGNVYLLTNPNGEASTGSVLCESDTPGQAPAAPTQGTCPEGAKPL